MRTSDGPYEYASLAAVSRTASLGTRVFCQVFRVGIVVLFAGLLTAAAFAGWFSPRARPPLQQRSGRSTWQVTELQVEATDALHTYEHTFRVDNIADQSACLAKCQSLAVCKAFVWDTDPNQCWLQGGLTGDTYPNQGVTSVVVRGSTEPEQPPSPITKSEFNYQAAQPQAFTCQSAAAPALWEPNAAGSVQVKVLSFNLAWWTVFDGASFPGYMQHYKQTNGNGATTLIAQAVRTTPYDVLAFQECNDCAWAIGHSGLAGAYAIFQGTEGICMAYRREAWSEIGRGQAHVTEDQRNLFWGQREVQWLRLQHTQTGATLFVMNHHGPLPTNTGGVCGEASTANGILSAIATNSQSGDMIVLVGDFNANAAGMTIKTLEQQLHKVMSGTRAGGVDNIFTNMGMPIAKQVLGGGGSDHDALSVVLST